MHRYRDEWLARISNELEGRGFVRDRRAIPRSILSFKRASVTVELHACHFLRVLCRDGIREREYPNCGVAEALEIIRALDDHSADDVSDESD